MKDIHESEIGRMSFPLAVVDVVVVVTRAAVFLVVFKRYRTLWDVYLGLDGKGFGHLEASENICGFAVEHVTCL